MLGLDHSNTRIAVNARQALDWGERLTAIVGRGTMQGILQQVTGGRFRDGLVNGVASGLSAEVSRTLNIRINQWAAENNVPPFVASQLRMVGQGFASALARSAASGGQGGVEALLSDLISGEIGEAVAIDRAEVNALTTRYNEALRANDVSTQASVLNNLVDRWMNNHREDTREQALVHVTQGLGWTVDTSRFARDGNGQLISAAASTPATPTVDRPTAIARIAAAYRLNDPTISQLDAERAANAYIDQRGIPAVFPERLMLDVVVKPTGIDLELDTAERALTEARASNNAEALRNAALNYNNLLLRQAASENQFFRPTPFALVTLGLINPATGKPATAQDFENRVPHFGPGFFAQSYYAGVRELSNPNADWIDRALFGLASTAVLPLFLLEEMGRGLLNTPNAADRMAQYVERATLTTDADERILSSLQAVHAGTEVILGLGIVVPAGTAGGIATNELRTFTNLGAAREAVAEAVESSGGLNAGLMGGQRGAGEVVAILDGGRLLIRRGEQFFEFLVSQRNNRVQFTLTRDLTAVVDDVAPNRGTAIQELTPGQVANVERRMNTFDAYVDPASGAWTRNPTGVSDAAYTLERNLMAEGKLPPSRADYTPHHLVEFDSLMERAQRILNRFGINPNEAANGVWLDRSYHRQVHTGDYQAWVTTRLEQVVEAGGGRNEIVRELQNIATHLRNGKPIPLKPK